MVVRDSLAGRVGTPRRRTLASWLQEVAGVVSERSSFVQQTGPVWTLRLTAAPAKRAYEHLLSGVLEADWRFYR